MNKHSLRIMYSSNAAWSTSGYGNASAQFVPQLRDEGYLTAMIPFYGLEGGILDIDGVRMYPKIMSAWGEDALAEHGKRWKADISITNQDIWVLNPDWLKQVTRWIPHTPIDHDPAPKAVVDRLRLAYRIVVYSQFGKKALADEGLYSTYIPLTVDTEIMHPMDKMEARKKLSIPEDIFLFGIIAANKDNPARKSFQQILDAFEMFHSRHPKSGIYFGTMLQQQGGFPIMEYATSLGLEKFIYHVEPYDQMFSVGRPELAQIMSSFDCYLAPSSHEGFGMTIIEAQACGVPVITNDWTCMPELIEKNKTGFLTDVGYKWFSQVGSYWGVPSTQSIADQMEHMYKSDRKTMGIAGRKFVLENFDSKRVFNTLWRPFLQSIENEIYPSA